MFTAEKVAYSATGSFSRIVVDYLAEAERLRAFYTHRPTEEGLLASIRARQGFPQKREVLVDALKRQYAGIEMGAAVTDHIEALLSENTFTVTTAHQPALMTGPLYFIYKILHAIRLAGWLQKTQPQFRFVPVFYMGSEDADLAELNHFTVQGKRYTWNTKQTGAVGRMTLDADIQRILRELEGQLGTEPNGTQLVDLLGQCFCAGRTIQQATFELVHALFGRFGLVVLIADDARLKTLMQPVFEDDLFNGKPAEIVTGSSERLQRSYNVQAHPREINLFYLMDGMRSRIVETAGHFNVADSDISFTGSELRAELRDHPERFSPNVILRGLYQETILPNIAFIGGGGELAYWLQLKDLFEQYGVPFPALVLRNSFLIVDEKEEERIASLGLDTAGLFPPVLDQMNAYLERRGALPSLERERLEVAGNFSAMAVSAAAVNPTLSKHVAALQAQTLNKLEALEGKMRRAARKREEAAQRQLEGLKQKLFPGGLQERTENFSSYYARSGDAFIDALLAHSEAVEPLFTVLYRSRSASDPQAS